MMGCDSITQSHRQVNIKVTPAIQQVINEHLTGTLEGPFIASRDVSVSYFVRDVSSRGAFAIKLINQFDGQNRHLVGTGVSWEELCHLDDRENGIPGTVCVETQRWQFRNYKSLEIILALFYDYSEIPKEFTSVRTFFMRKRNIIIELRRKMGIL